MATVSASLQIRYNTAAALASEVLLAGQLAYAHNTGKLAIGDGSTAFSSLTNLLASSGISSLNGLTNATQTFATGNSGTDFNIVSTTSTHTFNFPTASATNRGLLSSADWTTFNNKGNGTVTSVAALTIGTTGTDLSSSVANGTTTPVITLNVPTASASNRGVLSSADWTTFNGKVSTGAITGSGLTMATARILGRTTAGSGAIEEISIGSGLSLSAGTLSATGGGGALSAITAATGTNTIDNLNFAQTWNWSTLNTQTAFSHNFNALTTGTAFEFLTSSGSLNSTNGMFRVANTGAATSGILARFQSNGTVSGSGLTLLANGSMGVGTVSPSSIIHASSSGAAQIRLTGGGGDIFIYSQATNNTGLQFGSGLLLRQSTPVGADSLELIGAQANAFTRMFLKGGTAGNTLIEFSCGTANNSSQISLYRGVTNTITLIDNNSADSFHNTGKSFCIGATAAGTSAGNCLVLKGGTAPTGSQTDLVHVYSADISAGNAALHIENENGETIKLYKVNNYTQTYSTASRTVINNTGIDNAQVGSVYASVSDLNSLAQVVNGLIDDLQTAGLIG